MYASNVHFASNACIVNAGNCSNLCTAVSRLNCTNDFAVITHLIAITIRECISRIA